jgi:hypothetical protein
VSSKKLSKRQENWDTMITDAERRIQKLKTVISVCEENKKTGEPWPGSEKAATHN